MKIEVIKSIKLELNIEESEQLKKILLASQRASELHTADKLFGKMLLDYINEG